MIVITIEGGVIQGVSSDDPAEQGKEVTIIDYDSEGVEPEEIHKVPQGEGETEDALIHHQEIGTLNGLIAEYLKSRA